jgi:UDP-N-acetylglucosamine acyltransferase
MIEYNKDAQIYKDNTIHPTAIIYDNVVMGKGNVIGPYTIIGRNGEIRGKDPAKFSGKVYIGDNNVISELVTIQRPYYPGKSTCIGSNNIIMAHVHIGHDVIIRNNCEICTSSIIGGHTKIGNFTKIKLNCTIRNRLEIGENVLLGQKSNVTKSLESNKTYFGNPAKER